VLLPHNLLWLLCGTVLGIIFGAIPALGPNFALALMLPLTFGFDPATALVFLAAVHAATAYGDSIASILINTPGGGGSIAACWDGFPLARQGKGNMALALSAMSSFFGGFMGWLSLVLLSPLLVAVALKLGPAEMFMVIVLGLSFLSVAVQGNTIKGLIAACFGLLLSVVGQDLMTGEFRYTFGMVYLEDGIDLVPFIVGLFALSEVMVQVEEGSERIAELARAGQDMLRGIRDALKEFVVRGATLVRAGAIGILMGILPVLGISTANVMAYLVEKRASRDPESFGKGNPSGLIAPEVAKSACVVGDLVPTLTLGIPGSSATAILLGALILHGVQPGGDFFAKGLLPYTVFAGILLAQAAFCVIGLLTARYTAKLVEIPNAFLLPFVLALCFVGAFCMRNRLDDVLVMIVFGVVGYLMKRCDYPLPALVLGFILGDLAEVNFNRALLIYRDYWVFFKRPIALGIFATAVLTLAGPYLWSMIRGVAGRRRGG
jgi:putative tricarboxylic transport membrane protein